MTYDYFILNDNRCLRANGTLTPGKWSIASTIKPSATDRRYEPEFTYPIFDCKKEAIEFARQNNVSIKELAD